MNETNPNRRTPLIRLLLLVIVLLAIIQFVVLIAVGPARSTRTVPQKQQPAAPITDPSEIRSIRPGAVVKPPGPPPAVREPLQKVLKYGSGEGELGLVHEREQEPHGPESFAIGKEGEILVADGVNQRVVLYSRDGTYLRSISIPGIALGDVMSDRAGRVYVYDQVRHALQCYDTDGKLQGALNLNSKDIDTRGYFHVVGDAVYFADAAARDVLVAVLKDGALAAPDNPGERRTEGIHGESGRIYSFSVDKGQALAMQMWDKASARSDAQTFQVSLPGVVSARYVGEDQQGRFHVQTERLAAGRIVLEVLSFALTGQQIGVTRMPENDYFAWTAKLVDVRPDGAIVQFLPQREQAKLNLFTN